MGTKTKMSMRDRLLARKQKIKDSSSGGAFHTIKEGVTRFRHLQLGPDEEPGFEVIYFYLGQDIKGMISPATFGLPCAVMKGYTKFKDSKNADDREFAKKFKPSKKYFGFGIKYKDTLGKDPDTQNGAKPIILTPRLYDELIDMYLDEEENGDFTDPVNGYDLKYTRTGKTMTDTEYSVRACKPTPAPKEFRKKVYSMEEEIKKIMPTYEATKEIWSKFMALDPEELEGKGDQKETTTKKKKKKSKDL